MAHADREKPKHDTVLDVTAERIARVYAQAFLGAAAKSPQAAELVAEVESVVSDVLDRFPQLEKSLRSELISHEHKQALLERIFGGRASVEVLNFLNVLSMHGRLGLLRGVAKSLRKLFDERRGMTEVEVHLATAPDDALRKEIHDQLSKALGCEPLVRLTVEPSLIAGMVIRVGDCIYDGSIQTQFNLARKAMVERAVDLIESQPERFVQAVNE